MKACSMAETVSRDVNVVKTRQVSVLFCVQVPRRKSTRKHPLCQIASFLNRKEQRHQDSKEVAFKANICWQIS